jgi:hypothetical protein
VTATPHGTPWHRWTGALAVLASLALAAQAQTLPPVDIPVDKTAAAVAQAGATDTEPSLRERVSFNTFGTLGLSRLNLAGTRAIHDAAATTGIGSQWTGAYDSRLGLQVQFRPAPTLDLTVQTVLRRRAGGDVRLSTQWAYLDWQPSPAWELKVGRYMSPLYLASDQHLIGLAHPWVRAPSEVYGLLGNVDSLDGIWLRHRMPLGERTLSIDVYQASHLDDRGDVSVNHRRLTGLTLNLRDARYTWHATVAESRTEIGSPTLRTLAGLIATPALGGDPIVAREYDLAQVDHIHFLAGGVRYEAGPWLVMSELVLRRSSSRALPGSLAGYVTLGHSWDAVLGYVTVAGLRGRDPGTETRLSGVAAETAEAFLQFGREYGQTSVGTGVRWDVQRGVALKAQVDYLRPRIDGRGGTFIGDDGTYSLPPGRRVAWLYSLALEWAF